MTARDSASPFNLDSPHQLAPWRPSLSRALHRNRSQPFCRFIQLATVRSDGLPANRTIVFRGFVDTLPGQGNLLSFISDRRSEKIAQIQQQPNVEACWYFTKTREQFRLSGQMTVITADTSDQELTRTRTQTWQKISDKARQQFAWPHPKQPRLEETDFDPPWPDEKQPLPDFCLLLLSPHTVDYLTLRGEPQDRVIYTKSTNRNGNWSECTVNP